MKDSGWFVRFKTKPPDNCWGGMWLECIWAWNWIYLYLWTSHLFDIMSKAQGPTIKVIVHWTHPWLWGFMNLLAGCSFPAEQVVCFAIPMCLPMAAACEPCRLYHLIDPYKGTQLVQALQGWSVPRCLWGTFLRRKKLVDPVYRDPRGNLFLFCPYLLTPWCLGEQPLSIPPESWGAASHSWLSPGPFQGQQIDAATHVLGSTKLEVLVCFPGGNGLVW